MVVGSLRSRAETDQQRVQYVKLEGNVSVGVEEEAQLEDSMRGIGKRTVVKMAAEELGLHVVEVKCFDLLGATEHKTATAIADAFETARRYSPAVLDLGL